MGNLEFSMWRDKFQAQFDPHNMSLIKGEYELFHSHPTGASYYYAIPHPRKRELWDTDEISLCSEFSNDLF